MQDSLSRSIIYLRVESVAGVDSPIFPLWVQCVEGAFLTAQSGQGSRVYARQHGTGTAFQDINSNPIPLSSNGLIAFDFKLHPILPTGRWREQIGVAIVQSGAALWSYIPPVMSNEIIGGPGDISSVVIDPTTGYIFVTDNTGNVVATFKNGQLFLAGSIAQVLGINTVGAPGVGTVRGFVSLTATANISTTTLYTPSKGESFYLIGTTLNIKSAATSGSAQIDVFYTDENSVSQDNTLSFGLDVGSGHTGNQQSAVDNIQTDGISPIRYSVTFSSLVGAVELDVRLFVQAIA
jgi:hypothetical protein